MEAKTQKITPPYKILVTGSRDWEDPAPIWEAIRKQIKKEQAKGRKKFIVLHGGAKGADSLADKVCEDHGIHTAIINARWQQFDKAAGPIRNNMMLSLVPDIVLVFHSDIKHSKGTRNCLNATQRLDIPYKVIKG